GATGGDQVEDQVGSGNPASGIVAANGGEQRCGGGTEVGTYDQRQGVVVIHLARRQGRQRQHQGGVAGLHDDSGQRTYQHEQEDAGPALNGKTGQVEASLETTEAGLHQVDAEKHQADAQQRQATTAPAGLLAPGEKDTEGQHRHRQLRHVELEAGQGNQPGPGGGTQVGAEGQSHPAEGVDQAGTEKGDPQQGHQSAGLDRGGTDYAHQQPLPQAAGAPLEPAFQRTAGEGPEALLQSSDTHDKKADPGCQGGQFGTPDHQTEQQQQQSRKPDPPDRSFHYRPDSVQTGSNYRTTRCAVPRYRFSSRCLRP